MKNCSISNDCLNNVVFHTSPHFNERPEGTEISLLVIHNISLPAGEFGTCYIDDLFLGQLDCEADTSFIDLKGLQVSAHCLIKRCGEVIQYVPFNKRAWHAGVSSYQGLTGCNDFSIGIELEGTDTVEYTSMQYQSLSTIAKTLIKHYPKLTKERILGHQDIAPGRKTDPGESFDWSYFNKLLNLES
ncbi:1,6-anhydro-N-acetylmuramyl-L-alanine amidase AmpD [Pseudoalteromonas denitrificans]|uniref:1,6-anhydro-N-acetylmuramyl-L-alanine amidase AmpD n=1 Tax=Pseudoalteromonas denitrificans DSM 6059 TaxID=1123010 RepID=A0A1I1JB24_9GAMM|nr:1,6-anhydro-N-acetylmuramyl-L-alanine amidase AmpD [Pseudoalteromonas denitrificans]SFC45754.1 AmpD protein [Pseudoalteromonas denitrificans DSM 6059]